MERNLITITEYCSKYNIESSFIDALEALGIIVLTIVDEERFIHLEQLSEMDRYIHLHYELEINIEGIDAIRHLLTKMTTMQEEIRELRKQLSIGR